MSLGDLWLVDFNCALWNTIWRQTKTSATTGTWGCLTGTGRGWSSMAKSCDPTQRRTGDQHVGVHCLGTMRPGDHNFQNFLEESSDFVGTCSISWASSPVQSRVVLFLLTCCGAPWEHHPIGLFVETVSWFWIISENPWTDFDPFCLGLRNHIWTTQFWTHKKATFVFFILFRPPNWSVQAQPHPPSLRRAARGPGGCQRRAPGTAGLSAAHGGAAEAKSRGLAGGKQIAAGVRCVLWSL